MQMQLATHLSRISNRKYIKCSRLKGRITAWRAARLLDSIRRCARSTHSILLWCGITAYTCSPVTGHLRKPRENLESTRLCCARDGLESVIVPQPQRHKLLQPAHERFDIV